jgi:hypothetical protein
MTTSRQAAKEIAFVMMTGTSDVDDATTSSNASSSMGFRALVGAEGRAEVEAVAIWRELVNE